MKSSPHLLAAFLITIFSVFTQAEIVVQQCKWHHKAYSDELQIDDVFLAFSYGVGSWIKRVSPPEAGEIVVIGIECKTGETPQISNFNELLKIMENYQNLSFGVIQIGPLNNIEKELLSNDENNNHFNQLITAFKLAQILTFRGRIYRMYEREDFDDFILHFKRQIEK